jgi:DNA-binding SARP family transcriptional activator
MDRLAEQLWDRYPPADQRSRLHSCASKVRGALKAADPEDEVFLAAKAGGYCLHLATGSVDVHRFHALASEARARSNGDDSAIATLTRDALQEWGPGTPSLHGPEPLGGLPGQWATDYRTTLRREYRNVLVEHVDARLRCSDEKNVIAEFAALADADEVGREDEQFIGLLMQAYYRTGRQADALRAYRRTCDSLRQKGLTPGKELRMLADNIYNQDPELGHTGKSTVGRGNLVPVPERDSGEAPDEESASESGSDDDAASSTDRQAAIPASPYSQHNEGHTVIANQGTQTVNLGGSNE